MRWTGRSERQEDRGLREERVVLVSGVVMDVLEPLDVLVRDGHVDLQTLTLVVVPEQLVYLSGYPTPI